MKKYLLLSVVTAAVALLNISACYAQDNPVDLTVDSVRVEPDPASTTRGSLVYARVTNSGNAAVSAQIIPLVTDSSAPPAAGGLRGNSYNIRPGTAEIRLVNVYPTQAGTKYLHVIVDSANQVNETNEGNNAFTRELRVEAPPPDIIVSNITVDNSAITYGRGGWVTFVVKNNGETAIAGPIRAVPVITRNGTPVAGTGYFEISGGLQPGEEKSHRFKVGHDNLWSPGSYTVQVTADSNNTVNESNENNNTSSTIQFTVTQTEAR